MNTTKKLWGISLLIISIIIFIRTFSSIVEIELSNNLIKTMGIISIVILPVFIYSTIKMFKQNKN